MNMEGVKAKQNPILTETKNIVKEQAQAASASPTPSPTTTTVTTPPSNTAQRAASGTTLKSPEEEKNEAIQAFRDQQGGNRALQDPNALTHQSPVWEGRRKNTRIIKDPDSPVAREVLKPGDLTRTLSDVSMDPYRWDAEKAKKMATLMEEAGYDTGNGNIRRMAGIWGELSQEAARFWMVGKRVSPLDILKRVSDGVQAAQPRTTTSTTTHTTITNALTAEQLAHAALSQRLGRDATKEELAEFKKALRGAEEKDPTTTTTTTTTDPSGSSTSTSKTKQGVNPADYAVSWSVDHNKEEAAAYQMAGLMMPWFFSALESPV